MNEVTLLFASHPLGMGCFMSSQKMRLPLPHTKTRSLSRRCHPKADSTAWDRRPLCYRWVSPKLCLWFLWPLLNPFTSVAFQLGGASRSTAQPAPGPGSTPATLFGLKVMSLLRICN